MYVAVSRGKDWYAGIILFITSLALRRQEMAAKEMGKFKAFWLTAISIFGLGSYAKVKAKYNHSFLIYRSEDFGQWFTVDITENGVSPMPLKKALRSCEYILVFNPTFNLKAGVKNTSAHFGRGYDWLGILGALFTIAKYIIVGGVPKNIFHSSGRDFCSEYVSHAIEASPGADSLGDPASIYPDQLYRMMKTSDQYVELPKEDVKYLGFINE
jgi:hypothetical protein